MIGIGIADSLGVNLSGLNPATKSFITSAGISDAGTVTTINNLVNGLQASGLWSKMKAVYPFVTDNRNLLGYTEDFGNAYWVKTNATVTTNTATAPNGTTTADKLTISGTGYHGIERNLNDSTNIRKIHSTYLKQDANVRYFELIFGNVSDGAIFDLQTGTVTATAAGVTAVITNEGNGWYRCSISGIVNYAYPSVYANSTGAFGGTTNSLSGSFYIWGSQFEYTALTTYQPIATTQQAYIASQFKYNLKDPRDLDAAFRLVFNGGWTHSSTGATPNGTNGYADTKFDQTLLSQTNGEIGVYSRTNIKATYIDIGVYAAANDYALFTYISISGDQMYGKASCPDISSGYNPTNSIGLFSINADGVNTQKFYKNGILGATKNFTSGATTSKNIYLSAGNGAATPIFYSTRQLALSYISQTLNATEAANLYSRVQQFQTALNRQV